MKLDKDTCDMIGSLILTLSIGQSTVSSENAKGEHANGKQVDWGMKYHDDAVEELREMGIHGPAKYNETKG